MKSSKLTPFFLSIPWPESQEEHFYKVFFLFGFSNVFGLNSWTSHLVLMFSTKRILEMDENIAMSEFFSSLTYIHTALQKHMLHIIFLSTLLIGHYRRAFHAFISPNDEHYIFVEHTIHRQRNKYGTEFEDLLKFWFFHGIRETNWCMHVSFLMHFCWCETALQ